MAKQRYVEPPVDPSYNGPVRMCSCGCGEWRPLTHDYFATHTVVLSYGTYHYLQYVRRLCRARIQREKKEAKRRTCRYCGASCKGAGGNSNAGCENFVKKSK